jgi:cation diffusion facilitator CzcD-associated flavoprotein CzcO
LHCKNPAGRTLTDLIKDSFMDIQRKVDSMISNAPAPSREEGREQGEGLAALRKRIEHDLQCLSYPDLPWVVDLPGQPDGTLDCAVVGGGQFGQAIAFGLKRERVDRVTVFDRNPPGLAGPWMTFARMNMLRTPKDLTGPDLGVGSLTFRAWYEAQHGAAGWAALDRIPRPVWQGFLNWHRDVTGIHVESNAHVVAIEPVKLGENTIFKLSLNQNGATREVLARTVVLSSGAEGSGKRVMPSFIRDALPSHLYAHSNDEIDFSALKGKRVGILGAGAAAFDNAATALERGATEASLCFRRAALPQSNPRRWMEFSGYLAHYIDLPDAHKWAYMQRLYDISQPPPEPTFKRAMALPGFRLQAATPWDAVEATPAGTVLVRSGERTLEFDFVIVSTGMEVDLTLRPELAQIASQVALWGERYTPPAELAKPLLAKFPYLGRYCEFQEKTPGSAPWVSKIFTITRGATLTAGPSAASNSNMKYTAPRLIQGVTRALFLDAQKSYFDHFITQSHHELPDDLVAQVDGAKAAA